MTTEWDVGAQNDVSGSGSGQPSPVNVLPADELIAALHEQTRLMAQMVASIGQLIGALMRLLDEQDTDEEPADQDERYLDGKRAP